MIRTLFASLALLAVAGTAASAEEDPVAQSYAEGTKAAKEGEAKQAAEHFIKVYTRLSDGTFHKLAADALYAHAQMLESQPLRTYGLEEVEETNADSNWTHATKLYLLLITKVAPKADSDAAVRRGELLARLDLRQDAIAALGLARDAAKRPELQARAGAVRDALNRDQTVEEALAAGKLAQAAARGERPPETPADVKPVDTAEDVAEPDATDPETAGLEEVSDPDAAEAAPAEEEVVEEPAPVPESYVVGCYQAGGRLTIDGRLDDKAWKDIESVALDRFPWHDPLHGPKQRTDVRVLFDAKYLYVGFQAEDQDIQGRTVERDNMKITQEERLEIFVQPVPDTDVYYCFEVNAKGAVLDYKTEVYRKFDTAWNCKGTYTVARKSRGSNPHWVVEMAIPLRGLVENDEGMPTVGTSWQVGFYRIDRNPSGHRGGRELYAMWKSSGSRRPDFHLVESFGRMEFRERPQK